MRHSGPVRGCLRMAILTRERLVVRRVQVAVRTDRAIMRNAEIGVIKGRPQPARSHPGGVAGQAGGWIQRGYAVRHGPALGSRALPGRLLGTITIRVRRRETNAAYG